MKSLLIIVAVLALALCSVDLRSENVVSSVLAPRGVLGSLIALSIWMVVKGGLSGYSDGGGGSGGGACGGDGGGGGGD